MASATAIALERLTVAGQVEPIGVSVAAPEFGWQLTGSRRGIVQRAYEVRLAESIEALATAPTWTSGRVDSRESVAVGYSGPALKSQQDYWWHVRVWDDAGAASGWSEPAPFRTAILDRAEWQADWIGGPEQRERLPLLRTEFKVDAGKEIRRAVVSASARGIYELRLNGEKVGDHHLAPGWTDYDARIQFQTYDVTHQVRAGANAFGGALARGWYSGRLAHIGDGNYGDRESLIAQLRIEFADGSIETIATDGDWSTAPGPWVEADLIDGEHYDARFELDGWDEPGFDDTAWRPVWVAPSATDKLRPQPDEPVRETGVQDAIARTEPEPGAFVYDLGQNMVGVARIALRGEPGETVRLRYAEELNRDDGTMYTANLRSAAATDHYTFDERGEGVYEPTFTSHGFRYIEVTGTAAPPELSEVSGRVRGSDLRVTGELTTSSAMLNQLQSNIVWGQRGNFLSVPTDTPARDERLGWTGDISVFAPTASYNMDTLNFLSKWLVDLRDGQLDNGAYPGVAPYQANLACCESGYGWSDAGITVPYAIWQSSGSTAHIREGWESMTRYADYLEGELIVLPGAVVPPKQSPYGDWLHLDDPTENTLLAYLHDVQAFRLMAEMAEVVGDHERAERYRARVDFFAKWFPTYFIRADGSLSSDSQTAYAMAIGLDLVPGDRLGAVAEKFEAAIARRDYHLSTGFLGTPWLVPALAKAGKVDVAYRLLMNETFPSWGFEVAMGATTMWERWSSILPDGSFSSPEYPQEGMNSFNHYAYGAIGDFMYRSVGGIAPAAPGYREIRIAPTPGGGLTSGEASFESRYGAIRSSWRIVDGVFELDAEVPANTTATVVLPSEAGRAITEGKVPLERVPGVTTVVFTAAGVEISVGSGSYAFRIEGDAAAPVDHVDFGDAASEAAHAVGPKYVSGTGIEAGLTRRYSNDAFPESWFEATVSVPTSGEFRIRAIETFARASTKSYVITADGVEVARRMHTASAPGAYTYEIDVGSLAEQTADGKVVLRFQRLPGSTDGDPSLADVWIFAR